jgi:hypothetical protein
MLHTVVSETLNCPSAKHSCFKASHLLPLQELLLAKLQLLLCQSPGEQLQCIWDDGAQLSSKRSTSLRPARNLATLGFLQMCTEADKGDTCCGWLQHHVQCWGSNVGKIGCVVVQASIQMLGENSSAD